MTYNTRSVSRCRCRLISHRPPSPLLIVLILLAPPIRREIARKSNAESDNRSPEQTLPGLDVGRRLHHWHEVRFIIARELDRHVMSCRRERAWQVAPSHGVFVSVHDWKLLSDVFEDARMVAATTGAVVDYRRSFALWTFKSLMREVLNDVPKSCLHQWPFLKSDKNLLDYCKSLSNDFGIGKTCHMMYVRRIVASVNVNPSSLRHLNVKSRVTAYGWTHCLNVWIFECYGANHSR